MPVHTSFRLVAVSQDTCALPVYLSNPNCAFMGTGEYRACGHPDLRVPKVILAFTKRALSGLCSRTHHEGGIAHFL